MLCEPRDTLEQGKGHLQGQTTACFWACGPLCLPEASLAAHAQPRPWPSPITPGHSFDIREFGPEQRGKNTNQFCNNTFLSTTQTQQGQNKWRCHLMVKVKVLDTHAESQAAPHEGYPRPPTRTKLASHPRVGLIETEPDGHAQEAVVTGQCHHVQVSWPPSSREPILDRPPAQRGSGARGCPPGRCPSRPSQGWAAAASGAWRAQSGTSVEGRVAGLDSPAPLPHWHLGFLGTAKCPQFPGDLCAKTGHRRRTR